MLYCQWIRVPVPAALERNSASILSSKAATGPLKSVIRWVHECGSSTPTTVSLMLPSGPISRTWVWPTVPRQSPASHPLTFTIGSGDGSVPTAEHGGDVHLDDAAERLLRRDGKGSNLFDPHTIAHRPMLAFSGNSADVVQWQNISFPS